MVRLTFQLWWRLLAVSWYLHLTSSHLLQQIDIMSVALINDHVSLWNVLPMFSLLLSSDLHVSANMTPITAKAIDINRWNKREWESFFCFRYICKTRAARFFCPLLTRLPWLLPPLFLSLTDLLSPVHPMLHVRTPAMPLSFPQRQKSGWQGEFTLQCRADLKKYLVTFKHLL